MEANKCPLMVEQTAIRVVHDTVLQKSKRIEPKSLTIYPGFSNNSVFQKQSEHQKLMYTVLLHFH